MEENVKGHSAFDGARIGSSIFADVDPRSVQSIDVEEALDSLTWLEIIVLMKEMEGYRGNEIADYIRKAMPDYPNNTYSKQRVNAIKRSIRKKFLRCSRLEE